MSNQSITIRVSHEAARAYQAAPAEKRRELDALLSLKLSEATRTARPLKEVMGEISRKAQERGLTPEILGDLLNEP